MTEDRHGRVTAGAAAGALLSIAIAVLLFSRFSIDAHLSRDEAIYAYGGQQLADGVPFYASIFDVKTPLASQLAGLGVIAGRALGADDLDAIRVVFFLFACGTVAAVYLLGRWLWRSALAGLVGAAAFAAFRGFAMDAIGGPDAKTPGIFFAVLSMALVVRRRWFAASLAGSLAFLVWQPLAVYAAVAVIAAALTAEAGRRRRALRQALAGAAVPVAATALYFWLAGALPELVEAAFEFPLTGLSRGHTTLHGRVEDIVTTTRQSYGASRILFWGGLALLLALLVARVVRGRSAMRETVRDPLVCVVVPSLAIVAVFSLVDFQGYPDLYPALPYAALGLAGTAALVLDELRAPALRRAATAGGLIAVAALVVLCWPWYSRGGREDHRLVGERASAAAIERILDPGETLYALGDSSPLVLTGRRNPSRFIYLSSGVGRWAIAHTPGGFAAWVRDITAADPAVIVVHGWKSPVAHRTTRRLRLRYERAYVGNWRVFLRPDVRERAQRRGVALRALVPARS